MLKMKKVIASLACAVMVFMSMSTLCFAVESLDIQLNRRVTFVGDTYYDWNGKKVRKDNDDNQETSGMIISINNRKSKGIYISGQGYIGKDQIKAVEGKILEVEFDNTKTNYNYSYNCKSCYNLNNTLQTIRRINIIWFCIKIKTFSIQF